MNILTIVLITIAANFAFIIRAVVFSKLSWKDQKIPLIINVILIVAFVVLKAIKYI